MKVRDSTLVIQYHDIGAMFHYEYHDVSNRRYPVEYEMIFVWPSIDQIWGMVFILVVMWGVMTIIEELTNKKQ